jgi:hypothetical protein
MLISFIGADRARQRRSSGSRISASQMIFGWGFAPIAWAMGVPWRDAPVIGNLLGTRMALNEFVAYARLGAMQSAIDPKSFTIATFALCGSPTSARSASRSAASARSPRPAVTISRASASARCSPARWRTSSPRPLPGFLL